MEAQVTKMVNSLEKNKDRHHFCEIWGSHGSDYEKYCSGMWHCIDLSTLKQVPLKDWPSVTLHHVTSYKIVISKCCSVCQEIPLPLHKSEVSVQELVTANPQLHMPCVCMHVPSPSSHAIRSIYLTHSDVIALIFGEKCKLQSFSSHQIISVFQLAPLKCSNVSLSTLL
jgi:hypothetical protein